MYRGKIWEMLFLALLREPLPFLSLRPPSMVNSTSAFFLLIAS
jgi:hypothetical protein